MPRNFHSFCPETYTLAPNPAHWDKCSWKSRSSSGILFLSIVGVVRFKSHDKRKTTTSNTAERWAMRETIWKVVGGENK
jgi:hypothetical protein